MPLLPYAGGREGHPVTSTVSGTIIRTWHREPPENPKSLRLPCIEVFINPKRTVLGVNLCGNPPLEDSMNPCQRVRAVS
jgi:hypothetical protein